MRMEQHSKAAFITFADNQITRIVDSRPQAFDHLFGIFSRLEIFCFVFILKDFIATPFQNQAPRNYETKIERCAAKRGKASLSFKGIVIRNQGEYGDNSFQMHFFESFPV